MWPPASDDSLMTAFATGDARAAAAFVQRFQARVHRLALTIVRDRQLAEEVAQETFVRAWRYAGSYDRRRGAPAAWLLTIARNQAIDAVRLRGVETADLDLPALERELSDPAADGAQAAGELSERERVRQALLALPVEQRRPVVLAVYLGRTAREISELDGIPLGTVKTRIRTAYLRLRSELAVCDEPFERR